MLPALVCELVFAVILVVMKSRAWETVTGRVDSVIPRLAEVLRYRWTILRSGIIGTTMGLIPGVGEDMGAWVSYAAARRASREREQFGFVWML